MRPFAAVILYVSLSFLTSQSLPAQSPSTEPKPVLQASDQISISASPVVVQPGKSTLTFNLGVTATECDKVNADLTTYTLQITGTGLSLSQPHPGKCIIDETLSVDPSAPAGNYKLLLMDKDGTPRGYTDIAVLEPSAGAIPSGLAPQVDVMWDVLSQSVCNDVFGKRVARNFYCIEIKIGNNTGHPLQLAGVGFSNHLDKLPGSPIVIHANTSYASTRAVLLREEVLSPRNIFYHSLQGTGLVMAGFIPFFHAANAGKNYATAVSIVTGPLLQAINIAGPDRVVGQLNNLDDESFRDNQVVPNNAQIRTIVFVEKRALTEQLASISDEAANGHSSALLGVAPQSQQKNENGNQQAASNASDLRTTLQSQTLQARKNSEQKDTNWLFKFSTGDFSPLIVKLALGNMVVIGDVIEYLQRVQVQATPSTGTASSVTVTPSELKFSDENVGSSAAAQNVTVTNSTSASLTGFSVTLSGTNLNDFSQTNTCGTTVSAGANCAISVAFTPTAQGARAGSLVVAYGGGSQTVSLTGVGISGVGGGLVNFTPTTVPAFASQKVGNSSSPQTLTLTNSGTSPLTGFSASMGGLNASDFSQSSTCTATIAAGANCNLSLTFKPTGTGPRVGTLTITYTLGGAQQTPSFPLSGTGQ